MTVPEFTSLIQSLNSKYPFSITSWIRSGRRNHEVGGLTSSYHLVGLAVDVILDIPTAKESFIKDARKLGLDAIDELDHVHLEPSDK